MGKKVKCKMDVEREFMQCFPLSINKKYKINIAGGYPNRKEMTKLNKGFLISRFNFCHK